jgi:uncharacterized protein with von Willebrand factor type A (vWA) domain
MVLVGLVVSIGCAAAKHEVKPVPARTPASVVFVIDRSGSMTGAKLDAAKQAIVASIDVLAPDDMASLVIFDSDADIVFSAIPASKKTEMRTLVDGVTPGGGTNILPGLAKARELVAPAKGRKHVMLLSDGEAPSEGIAELVAEMKAENISISAIGVEGADENMLRLISDGANGRVYMLPDFTQLPKVFTRELAVALK